MQQKEEQQLSTNSSRPQEEWHSTTKEEKSINNNKKGVCHIVWPCHLHFKSILRQKRRIMETLKYFTMQKYNLQKNPNLKI